MLVYNNYLNREEELSTDVYEWLLKGNTIKRMEGDPKKKKELKTVHIGIISENDSYVIIGEVEVKEDE